MGVRERLIIATVELMRRGGTANAGIASVVTESGVARRSIYLHFPAGKSELVAEATRAAGGILRNVLLGDRLTSAEAAQTLLDQMIEHWRNELQRTEFQAGCPIAAAVLAGSDEPEIVASAGDVFTDWQTQLVDQLVATGMAADTATTLATTVIASVEGAILMCLGQRSTAPLDAVHSSLSELMRTAVRQPA